MKMKSFLFLVPSLRPLGVASETAEIETAAIETAAIETAAIEAAIAAAFFNRN